MKKLLNKKTLTDLDIRILKEKYQNNFENQLKKVKNNYPIQYLIGDVEFLNTKILVNPSVLIPRFETEYLVEKIINKLKNYQDLNILDICTGSGCIAIALSKNLSSYVSALDISLEALELAKKNATLNNVNINFFKQDILNTIKLDEYDVYVSNPPYISKEEKVDDSVKYEPSIALYAENNGLEFYEKIINLISNTPKLIAFEIGETEDKYIIKIAKEKFPKARISIEKDLAGKNRYIFIEHC